MFHLDRAFHTKLPTLSLLDRAIYIERPTLSHLDRVLYTRLPTVSLFLWPSGAPSTSLGFRIRLLSECRRAGLRGNFNGYSLRIGGAAALAARGVEVEVIRKLGRWRSDSVRRYLKEPKDSRPRQPACLITSQILAFSRERSVKKEKIEDG